MMWFIILLVLLSLFCVPFGAVAKGWKGAVIGLLIALVISGLITLDNYAKEQEWNGGICSRCGQAEYQFNGAAKSHSGHETLYYVCPSCGDLIRQ